MTQGGKREGAGLGALAADLEALQHRVDQIGSVAEKAAAAAEGAHRGIAQVLEAVTAIEAAGDGSDDPGEAATREPWLTLEDPEVARKRLAALVQWLGAVYLQYEDGGLPDCWMWHPGVVAELLALRDAWTAAHYSDRASADAVMHWHDRYRPSTAERVRKTLTDCGLHRHNATGDRLYQPHTAPATDQADEVATWWATTHGNTAAPPVHPGVEAAVRAQRSTRDW